jgi:hypothetical protein
VYLLCFLIFNSDLKIWINFEDIHKNIENYLRSPEIRNPLDSLEKNIYEIIIDIREN